jgi:hypothetical protein
MIKLKVFAVSSKLLTRILTFNKELWLFEKVSISNSILKGNDNGVKSIFPARRQIKKIARQDNADRYFDAAGIIHLEFVPVDTTIKSRYYFLVSKRLYVSMYRVRKEKFRNKTGCSCMIRCRLTRPLNVNPFRASKSICMIPQPPYLPHLSPANFSSSRRWKSPKTKEFQRHQRHPTCCDQATERDWTARLPTHFRRSV